jgi:ABC-2 type transport system permease protein/oleandomycin transport system permease protein
VLAARTLSDTLRHVISIFIMAGVGYAIGYRFHGTLVDLGLALLIVTIMGLAFSWIACTIGLLVRDTQTAEIAGFTWVFPVVFASSIFVPVETMRKSAEWLAWFAERNPITLASNAARSYSFGVPAGNDPWISLAWCAGIIAVFATLSVWRFRNLS